MSLLTNISCVYKLDGNSVASVGTNNGVDTDVLYNSGRVGQAANFNGTSSRILIADSGDFTFGSGDFSVAMWFRFAIDNTTRYAICGQLNSSGTNASASIALQKGVGGSFGTKTIVLSAFVGSTGFLLESTISIADTNWHHLVALRDGNTLRMYIDGVARGTMSIAGTINNSVNSFGLGQVGDFASFRLLGSLDEFYVWKRKLEVSEISQLAAGVSYPFTNNAMFNFFLK